MSTRTRASIILILAIFYITCAPVVATMVVIAVARAVVGVVWPPSRLSATAFHSPGAALAARIIRAGGTQS